MFSVFLVEKQTLSASNLTPAYSKPYVTQTNSNINFLKRKRYLSIFYNSNFTCVKYILFKFIQIVLNLESKWLRVRY